MKRTIRILSLALCLALFALALVACGPKSDPEKAKKALEKNGYTIDSAVDYLAGLATAITGNKTIDTTLTAHKDVEDKDGNTKTQFITIVYYKTAADAKADWENAKKDAEDDKQGEDSDWVVARSGRMIYWGTKAAVKAAA